MQTAVVSILDDARLFFSAQTDFAALQDNFDFLNPSNRHWSHSNCKDSEKEPHDAWCNDADTYLKVGFLILYCILSWCDDGFQGSTFEFIWTKNCKKNFLKEIYTKKRKRWWKEKKIRVNLVGKMITFFVLLSGTAKKCFYFAERKMERKLKMDVKSNLDGDYIVKISSSKKGQYKPK